MPPSSLPSAFRIVALGCVVFGLGAPSLRAQEAPAPRVVEVAGVTLTIPGAWTSAPTAATEQGVRRVTLAERAEASPVRGASLVVEVLPGLNPLQQERWLRGQFLRGLDASMTIAPTDLSLLGGSVGTAVSFRHGDHSGYALYTRGGPFYAVRVEAPAALWQDAEATQALLGLARSVRVTD